MTRSSNSSKLLLLGGAAALAYLLFRGGGSSGGGGDGSGSAGGQDAGVDPTVVSPDGGDGAHVYIPPNQNQRAIDLGQSQDQTSSTFSRTQQVGFTPNFSSEMFGAAYVTPTGFAPVTDKNGIVIGGYDTVNKQSVQFTNASFDPTRRGKIAPNTVTKQDATANASFENMSRVPTSEQGGFTDKVKDYGLLALTTVASPVSDFGAHLLGGTTTESKLLGKATQALAPSVEDGMLSAGAKKVGSLGLRTVPFVGLAAGITIDSTGALGGTKYPLPVAIVGNVAGDFLGGAGGTAGSSLGPVGTVGGAVGGQILGEQAVYQGYGYAQDHPILAHVGEFLFTPTAAQGAKDLYNDVLGKKTPTSVPYTPSPKPTPVVNASFLSSNAISQDHAIGQRADGSLIYAAAATNAPASVKTASVFQSVASSPPKPSPSTSTPVATKTTATKVASSSQPSLGKPVGTKGTGNAVIKSSGASGKYKTTL